MRRSPHRPTPFPYTTLFRSEGSGQPLRRRFASQRDCAAFDLGPGHGTAADRRARADGFDSVRSEEHTSELQSLRHLVCSLLLEKKKTAAIQTLLIVRQSKSS